jgi:outer membrane biosynthesis protein TonB
MRAEVVSLTASVLINAGILFSIDHVTTHHDQALVAHQKKAAKESSDSLSFEFVEAPPKTQTLRQAKTRKISDRDTASQDLTRDKTPAEKAPYIKTKGSSDQLAQNQMQPSRQPAKASPKIAEKVSPVLGSTGQDRIITSEISKTKSHGAQLYGITSFEATGSGMGVYMKNLKEKIWLAWFPYLVIHYPKDFKTADAVVNFKLNAKGEVKTMELLESKGSPLFAAFCVESIRRAGSFGPLPQEILDLVGKEELDIKFAFHYR